MPNSEATTQGNPIACGTRTTTYSPTHSYINIAETSTPAFDLIVNEPDAGVPPSMLTLTVTTYLTSYPSVTSTFTLTVQFTCPTAATGLDILTIAPTLSFMHDPAEINPTTVQLSTFLPVPAGFNCFNVVAWHVYESGGVMSQSALFANFIETDSTIELVGNASMASLVKTY